MQPISPELVLVDPQLRRLLRDRSDEFPHMRQCAPGPPPVTSVRERIARANVELWALPLAVMVAAFAGTAGALALWPGHGTLGRVARTSPAVMERAMLDAPWRTATRPAKRARVARPATPTSAVLPAPRTRPRRRQVPQVATRTVGVQPAAAPATKTSRSVSVPPAPSVQREPGCVTWAIALNRGPGLFPLCP